MTEMIMDGASFLFAALLVIGIVVIFVISFIWAVLWSLKRFSR